MGGRGTQFLKQIGQGESHKVSLGTNLKDLKECTMNKSAR